MPGPKSPSLDELLAQVRACTLCKNLPMGPGPILQCGSQARVLIAGQAPGRVTQAKGRPFDDLSGERLRAWLGVSHEQFYDPDQFAIVPMGFCFPGTAKGGDLPPRPRCARTWRQALMDHLHQVKLVLPIGRYAIDWHLPEQRGRSLTQVVADWSSFVPGVLPMPHPSPRNLRWLRNNPHFENQVVSWLQGRVRELLQG